MGDRRQARWIGAGRWALILFVLGLVLCPQPARGQGLLRNADFEGSAWQTLAVGTSISSWLAEEWQPWSVLGDQTENREVEYKLITLETSNSTDLRSHVRSGRHAQQFFTNGASHTAGFYQRVAVPAKSQVTFTIWVQIQSGNKLIWVDGHYVSDLSGGGGNYWAQVGIDPGGARPAAFGAPLPSSIQWSEPMWDITAHGVDEKGNPADLWVPVTVSARAQGEYVTVYTRGQCKYPTKYNTSFWDDASLQIVQPPTATPRPPTSTPLPTPTETPSPTPVPTNTAAPTDTPAPTSTPMPTATATSTATATPTGAARPTAVPTASQGAMLQVGAAQDGQDWRQVVAVVVVGGLALVVGVLGLIVGRALAGKGRRDAGGDGGEPPAEEGT